MRDRDVDGWRRVRALYRRLYEHVEARGDVPSWLSARLWYLAERYEGDGGLGAILAASDADLLKVQGFGPKSLATVRAMRASACADPWRDHAEMVAGVR